MSKSPLRKNRKIENLLKVDKATPISQSPPKSPKYKLPENQFPGVFEKQIDKTIKIFQFLQDSSQPQKCLQHNLNFSLYCENQRKPLCLRCMYQNNAHKIHSVKPLAQTISNLIEDCQNLSTLVKKQTKNIKQLQVYVENQIDRAQREYPPAKDKVGQLFKALHQYLFDLQKQISKQLRDYKSLILEQNNIKLKNLKYVLSYIEEKTNKQSNQQKEKQQSLIGRKNILDVLTKAEELINETMNIDISKNEPLYKIGDDVVDKIRENLKKQLQQQMPWKHLIPKQNQDQINLQNKGKTSIKRIAQKNDVKQSWKNKSKLKKSQQKSRSKSRIKKQRQKSTDTNKGKSKDKDKDKDKDSIEKKEKKTLGINIQQLVKRQGKIPPFANSLSGSRSRYKSRSRSHSRIKTINISPAKAKQMSTLMRKDSLLIIKNKQKSSANIKKQKNNNNNISKNSAKVDKSLNNSFQRALTNESIIYQNTDKNLNQNQASLLKSSKNIRNKKLSPSKNQLENPDNKKQTSSKKNQISPKKRKQQFPINVQIRVNKPKETAEEKHKK